MDDLKVGDTIPAGTLVLITSGEYSNYGVSGLYRATGDVVVPGRPNPWGRPGELSRDVNLLSTLLEEVPYREAWGGQN